ncbi:MAG TPA: FkbM family methyltransferase, partial [Stellaceae bacterium]|nr:FkbM family methyltransferase [Stellaceae bacterium]
GFSIDAFRATFRLAPPHYLKLDIDGNEGKVLAGARATLADPALRSIMIEVDREAPGTQDLFDTLKQYGFAFARWGVDHGLGAINAEFNREA